MTYVLTDTRYMPAAKTDHVSEKSSVFKTFVAAVMASRMRSAERQLRAHSALIGEAELVLGGFPQTTLSRSDALPFNR